MDSKVYGCQFDIDWENKPGNYKRVRALLQKRGCSPGSLVVLPEMFATGFSMNASAIAERQNGPTDHFLRDLAREKQVFVLGGLARFGSDGRTFNQAVCFAPTGKRVGAYDKLHLFSPGGESDHYSPGDGITLFRWAGFKVAVFICYDLRFPEVFRMAVARGANVIIVIANWPEKRRAHWLALLRARAIENQAYVVGVNRLGRDPLHEYSGDSLAVDPWGETIATAGAKGTVLSANLDLTTLRRTRAGLPVLRDTRARVAIDTDQAPRRKLALGERHQEGALFIIRPDYDRIFY